MIAIAEDVARLLEDRQRAWPCHTNRSSSMGHPCTRNLVYARTSWDKASSIDPFLAGIFATGNVLEGPIARILSEAGEKATPEWRIIGGQQAISDSLLSEHQITGHIDGLLQEYDVSDMTERWITKAVCDVKTCSDYTYDAIRSVDDLLKDRDTFFFKWYVQLQLYMLGMGIEQACLIMVRKSNLYDFKAIWFNIDYGEAERQLGRAKEINLAIDGRIIMPDKINRPKVCNRCQFVHICNPRLELDEGEKFDDAETEALLDRRAELKDSKTEFVAVDKLLKAALPKGVLIRCGKWIIEGKLIEPKDKAPYWKRTYELMPELPTVEQVRPRTIGGGMTNEQIDKAVAALKAKIAADEQAGDHQPTIYPPMVARLQKGLQDAATSLDHISKRPGLSEADRRFCVNQRDDALTTLANYRTELAGPQSYDPHDPIYQAERMDLSNHPSPPAAEPAGDGQDQGHR